MVTIYYVWILIVTQTNLLLFYSAEHIKWDLFEKYNMFDLIRLECLVQSLMSAVSLWKVLIVVSVSIQLVHPGHYYTSIFFLLKKK